MKVFIETARDRSVGIWPQEITLTIEGYDWAAPWAKDQLKVKLRGVFEEMLDEPVEVRLESECPDCGADGFKDCECSNPNCINNLPLGDE